MNKKLITSFVSAALVCSMGMSGVSAVTPVPTMHNNNQVTAASLSRSIADYKKIEGINNQTVLGADFTHYSRIWNGVKRTTITRASKLIIYLSLYRDRELIRFLSRLQLIRTHQVIKLNVIH